MKRRPHPSQNRSGILLGTRIPRLIEGVEEVADGPTTLGPSLTKEGNGGGGPTTPSPSLTKEGNGAIFMPRGPAKAHGISARFSAFHTASISSSEQSRRFLPRAAISFSSA